MTGKMEGRRERGGPRKKYLDAMKEIVEGRWTDVQIRRRMKNREEWRSLVADVRKDTALR